MKEKIVDGVGRTIQALWILCGFAIPLLVFYAFFPTPKGYEMIFENHTLGVVLCFGGFAISFSALIASWLIAEGDAQQEPPSRRLIYSLMAPLYPFYTTFRSALWLIKVIRVIRSGKGE